LLRFACLSPICYNAPYLTFVANRARTEITKHESRNTNHATRITPCPIVDSVTEDFSKISENKGMEVTFWRDLAVVWLALFCFIGLLIPLALLYFTVRGVNALHGLLYRLAQQGQGLSGQARRQVTQVSAQVDEQAVRIQGQTRRVEALVRKVLPSSDRG
jgi:hypothetical protein